MTDLFLQLLLGIFMTATSYAGRDSVRSVPFWVGVILIILALVQYSLGNLIGG